MSENQSNLLIIILDTNPVWWGQRGHQGGDAQFTLLKILDSLLVFANSYLMMCHQNKLAFIAAHKNKSHFLYPPKNLPSPESTANGETGQQRQSDGKYELFAEVDNQIKTEIKELVSRSADEELCLDCILAGAMSMALCYIHRICKETPVGENLSSRILVIKGSEDNPAQYMNFMNTVFTAQKQNVVVDACILDNESSLLQQACDITGGTYLKVPQIAGLLQYLLWIYLPEPAVRHKLTLPPRVQVDYRAACFCHRNLIDVGYVCSVCLSKQRSDFSVRRKERRKRLEKPIVDLVWPKSTEVRRALNVAVHGEGPSLFPSINESVHLQKMEIDYNNCGNLDDEYERTAELSVRAMPADRKK